MQDTAGGWAFDPYSTGLTGRLARKRLAAAHTLAAYRARSCTKHQQNGMKPQPCVDVFLWGKAKCVRRVFSSHLSLASSARQMFETLLACALLLMAASSQPHGRSSLSTSDNRGSCYAARVVYILLLSMFVQTSTVQAYQDLWRWRRSDLGELDLAELSRKPSILCNVRARLSPEPTRCRRSLDHLECIVQSANAQSSSCLE